MQRYLWALAVLVGLGISSVQAQYVRIKIDLNEYKVDPTATPTAGSSGPGFPGPGGGSPGFPGPGGMPGGGPGGMPGGGPGFPGPGAGGPMGGGYPGSGAGSPMGGMPGQPYDPMNPGGVVEEPRVPPVWLEVRLPIKEKDSKYQHPYALVAHEWGSSIVMVEDMKYFSDRTPDKRFESLKKSLGNEVTKKDKLLFLANWALQHGLLTEFEQTMKSLEKKDEKDPVVVAYKTVQKQMEEARKGDDPGAVSVINKLKAEGYTAYPSKHGLYNLYTTLSDKDKGIALRLKQLDRTYQSFYYWFALKGKVLAQPKYRLVAVLESTPKDFRNKFINFESRPMTDAGFTARTDNVIFLSAQPVGDVFAHLAENNNNYAKELQVSQEKILAGTPVNLEITNKAKLQTLALVQKALEEETAVATTTHEAIQQLLAATDLLPQNVASAEWLRYGLASFFETPRLSFFDCTALPSWTNLIYFKHHRKATKKLSPDQNALVLYRVITDYYISQSNMAAQLAENADDKNAARKMAKEKMELAHGTAWALTYYLMNQNPEKLFAYCEELKKLPRDTEYSPEVLAGCFGRALGWKQGAPGDAMAISMQDLKNLSDAWYNNMEDFTVLDIQLAEQISLNELTAPPPPKKKQPTKKGPGSGPGGVK